jgi:hypothetical protein
MGVLLQNGYRALIQAGSMSWPIVSPSQDDGKSPTHFSYEWSPWREESQAALRLGQLSVEGQNKDDDTWTSIPIQSANVTGKPVSVALNRTYLTHALRFGLNELEVEHTLSPVVFSNGGKKLVIMLINLEGRTTITQPVPKASEATTPAAEQTAPQEQPGATTEERTNMPRTARATTPETETTTFQPVETHASNNNGNGNGSAVKSLVDHVEQIKENLKTVIEGRAHALVEANNPVAVSAIAARGCRERMNSREVRTVRIDTENRAMARGAPIRRRPIQGVAR